MKKIFLAAVIAVSVLSSSFASPVKEVNYFVLNSFKDNFGNVTSVQWVVNPTYTKAMFVFNNVRTEAFYKPNGELIGTTQAIAIDELPLAAKRSFAKKYGNLTVKEAIRFDGNDETAYFISAENEEQSVILKANNTSVAVYKMTNKN